MKKRDVAIILLFNENKEVLLQHRSDDAKRLPGYWAFFGGAIETSETPLEAVKREALEEIGYKLKAPKAVMLQPLTGVNLSGSMHVFMEKYDSSQKLELNEGQGMKWVALPIDEGMKIIDHDKEVLSFIEGKY